MADEATEIAKEALEVPDASAKSVDEVAKMVEIGCGTIMTDVHASSWIREALSEASNDHNENAKDVAKSPSRRARLPRGSTQKVMKVR